MMKSKILKWLLALLLVAAFTVEVFAKPVTVLAFGDSLTAGLGLAPAEAFPARLEAALKAKYPEIKIVNAGVSGDTTADGLARLDWALSPEVNAVMVELGANDALRGLDPALAEKNLDQILAALKARKLPVLLLGMRAPPNLGADYAAKFDPLFQRLSEKYGVLLYPFFLEGVAADASLNQADGIHPNAQGVDVIVTKVAPEVEKLIGLVQQN